MAKQQPNEQTLRKQVESKLIESAKDRLQVMEREAAYYTRELRNFAEGVDDTQMREFLLDHINAVEGTIRSIVFGRFVRASEPKNGPCNPRPY